MRRVGTGPSLSGGTTGDSVASVVDDRKVDSRFRGNDEMRVGLWVLAGGHSAPRSSRGQAPAPTITVGARTMVVGQPRGVAPTIQGQESIIVRHCCRPDQSFPGVSNLG